MIWCISLCSTVDAVLYYAYVAFPLALSTYACPAECQDSSATAHLDDESKSQAGLGMYGIVDVVQIQRIESPKCLFDC
jgi:hypothetical protein